MSASATLPTATTRPTDERDGEPIEDTRVECPYCDRSGTTSATVNLCRCGRWFEVVTEEADR